MRSCRMRSLLIVFVLAIAYRRVADARCDFNNDGFADLAIGVTGEGENGAVAVLYGGSNGLSATNNQLFQAGVNIDVNGIQLLGFSLSCGDFNGDGRDDLAIGAPFSAVNGLLHAGSVVVLYSTTRGLTTTGF